MKAGKRRILKILAILAVIIMIAAGFAWYLYKGNATGIAQTTYIRLSEKDDVNSISDKLETECGLKFPLVFKWVAGKMNLSRWIKKGRYEVKPGMTLVEVVRVFREGKSKTVNLVIRALTNMEMLAGNCGSRLEADSADYSAILQDTVFLSSLGFNRETVYALPLPDTYNIYWHTEPDELLLRLKEEYNKFWNTERNAKADSIGLSPLEVSILASIVSKETNKTDEMPMVAGMYLNRLKTGMALQADPTIKFALKEPGLKRIYKIHLEVASPYNTYLNKGLPPGPICVASKQAIEAVLNKTQHNFLFMCAKDDFSGYHTFATTYDEHLKNARKYQLALDRNGVK